MYHDNKLVSDSPNVLGVLPVVHVQNLPQPFFYEGLSEVEPRITGEIFSVLSVEKSVASRTSYGGTAPQNVREQAQKWLDRLGQGRNTGATLPGIPSH